MATRRLRAPAAGAQEERERPDGQEAQALVIGFGRFGQTVAQMLATAGLDVTMIDRNVPQIDTAEEFGIKVFFGDGLRLDMLRQAGAREAKLICFCIDGDQVEPEFLASVREAFPDAALFVRTFDRRHVMKLAGSDIAFQVRELRESAIAMGRAALDYLDTDARAIEQLETDYRENDMARLQAQIEAGDLHAGIERNILHGRPERG